jgi:hypothetical protein
MGRLIGPWQSNMSNLEPSSLWPCTNALTVDTNNHFKQISREGRLLFTSWSNKQLGEINKGRWKWLVWLQANERASNTGLMSYRPRQSLFFRWGPLAAPAGSPSCPLYSFVNYYCAPRIAIELHPRISFLLSSPFAQLLLQEPFVFSSPHFPCQLPLSIYYLSSSAQCVQPVFCERLWTEKNRFVALGIAHCRDGRRSVKWQRTRSVLLTRVGF